MGHSDQRWGFKGSGQGAGLKAVGCWDGFRRASPRRDGRGLRRHMRCGSLQFQTGALTRIELDCLLLQRLL
jgi:hypothetical protein